ncbi:MAG: YDG domain-containing protein [Chitinispirillia bacterium]|nr:YDG domain-containing protein [Chitinispirillia bacterium]MCL2242037.1 YDG domain-containing protein [Chitinispirillia bacterium]
MPTKPGYEFLGWYDELNGRTYWPNEQLDWDWGHLQWNNGDGNNDYDEPPPDIPLYALWEVGEYGLILTPDKQTLFPNAAYGYIPQTQSLTATVTVENIGSSYTGPLEITAGPDFNILNNNAAHGISSGGTATFQVSPKPGLPVGNHKADVTVTILSSEYNESFEVDFTVTKAPLTVTAKSDTVTYGSPLPSFSAIYSGFRNEDDADSLGGKLVFVCTPPYSAGRNAGTYSVRPDSLTSPNYNISFVSGTLTVNRRPVEIANVTLDTKVYNGDTDVPSGTIRGILMGVYGADSVYAIPAGAAVFKSANAGTAVAVEVEDGVWVLAGDNHTNYVLSNPVYSGTITGSVTKRPLIVQANDMLVGSGGNSPLYTYSLFGLAKGDTAYLSSVRAQLNAAPGMTYSVPGFNSSVTSGEFVITPAGGGALLNYNIAEYRTGKLTVTNKSVMGASEIVFNGASVVYDGAPKAHKVAHFNGSGSNFTYTYSGESNTGVAYPPTPNPPVNAGTYQVTARYEDESSMGIKTVALTIQPKPLAFSMFRVDTLTYLGKPVTHSPVAEDGGKKVTFNLVRCTNNTGVGTAYAEVSGTGNYTGTLRVPFIMKSVYTVPEGIAAVYGQSLADIDLSEYGDGWFWMDTLSSVGSAGIRTHYLVYRSDEHGIEIADIVVRVSVAKAAQSADGLVALLERLTYTSVTMYSDGGGEWEYSADGGGKWQDSPLFTGLSPNMQYAVSVRKRGSDNYLPSEPEELQLRTPRLPGADVSPPAPEEVSVEEKTEVPQLAKAAERGRIALDRQVVSDKVSFTVNAPAGGRFNVVIFDNLGNAVFRRTGVKNGTPVEWNLTGRAGRVVSGGSYLIVAAGRGSDGKAYRYSAVVRAAGR